MLNGCTHTHVIDQPYNLWGTESYIQTDSDKSLRHIQWLTPDNVDDVQGCLLIVHGMNEHSGRYGDIARHFSSRFIVLAIDLTAHGLSNQVLLGAHKSLITKNKSINAGDAYLEQSKLRNLQLPRDDIKSAVSFLKRHCQAVTNKTLPLYILSHSLGSLVSASFLLQPDKNTINHDVDGIIFSGPAFAVTKVPGWRSWFQNPLIDFTFHTHEHFLNPHNEPLPLLVFNQLLALITVPIQDGLIEFTSLPGLRTVFSQSKPSWVMDHLTDSEEELNKLNQDQYIINRSILNYVLGIEKEIINFRKRMAGFNIPYLLIYSEHDPITPAWGNLDFIDATFNNHSDNKIMLLENNAFHEQLFSEPKKRSQILSEIDNWLDTRLKGTK